MGRPCLRWYSRASSYAASLESKYATRTFRRKAQSPARRGAHGRQSPPRSGKLFGISGQRRVHVVPFVGQPAPGCPPAPSTLIEET